MRFVSALLLTLIGCGPSGHPVYDAEGVVTGVLAEEGQIIVDHGAIPGFMPAMEMNFDVADPGLLDTLEAGQRIRFKLEHAPKSYRILEAEVVDDASAGAAGSIGNLSLAAELDEAPDFELTDQAGSTVHLAGLRGKAVLLDFIYTRCPGPCPILTGTHVEVQRSLAPELRERAWFVSISLDPENDTPEALAEYARARGADTKDWSFLTGAPETIERVLAAYGVGSIPGDDGTIDHLTATFLIDPQGRIARRFLGLEHEPESLVTALHEALR